MKAVGDEMCRCSVGANAAGEKGSGDGMGRCGDFAGIGGVGDLREWEDVAPCDRLRDSGGLGGDVGTCLTVLIVSAFWYAKSCVSISA